MNKADYAGLIAEAKEQLRVTRLTESLLRKSTFVGSECRDVAIPLSYLKTLEETLVQNIVSYEQEQSSAPEPEVTP